MDSVSWFKIDHNANMIDIAPSLPANESGFWRKDLLLKQVSYR